jgi:2C-methyl-D-erythritol 2,4-cyclodiphosphate synthase
MQVESIFLKGKTAEGLGSVGRGKAIEAHVVCLLEN